MIVKMTREKALITFQNLQGLLTKEHIVKFHYALIRNKDKLETIFKEIKINQRKFDEKRIKICEFYSEKDENNNPIIENNNYKGLAGNKPFDEEISVISDKLKNYMEEEIEFDGYGIDPSNVPEKMIGNQLEAIMPFIFEDEEHTKNEIVIN